MPKRRGNLGLGEKLQRAYNKKMPEENLGRFGLYQILTVDDSLQI